MINFKYWRMKRNLTRVELAKMVGTSKNYIYELERGIKFPSKQMFDKIINALNICIIIIDASGCKECKCKRCPKRYN